MELYKAKQKVSHNYHSVIGVGVLPQFEGNKLKVKLLMYSLQKQVFLIEKRPRIILTG
jgi:hypothetical protein